MSAFSHNVTLCGCSCRTWLLPLRVTAPAACGYCLRVQLLLPRIVTPVLYGRKRGFMLPNCTLWRLYSRDSGRESAFLLPNEDSCGNRNPVSWPAACWQLDFGRSRSNRNPDLRTRLPGQVGYSVAIRHEAMTHPRAPAFRGKRRQTGQ